MTEKLTMKALKAQLDELESKVESIDPLKPKDDMVVASAIDVDEFERIKVSLESIRNDMLRLKQDIDKRSIAMEDLRNALNCDLSNLSKQIDETKANIPSDKEDELFELRQRIETLSEELGEASTVVQGLRATADTDMDAKTLQDKKIAEMKAQAEVLFSRMTRAEARADESEERFQRFQKERRNEGLLVGILAACAAGVTLVVLALALAGMI